MEARVSGSTQQISGHIDSGARTDNTVTVISNVRVFDGERLSEPTTVGMRDDTITFVGSGHPRREETVDGRGGTLLPGLIDAHVHVRTISDLDALARSGVTTVLDMASNDLATLARLKGYAGRPTVKSAGRIASAAGSQFIVKLGFDPSSAVSSPQDATRFVAQRVAEGADYIKVAVEDPRIPRTKVLDQATVTAIVIAAHQADMLCVAHVVSPETVLVALRAGCDIVTHTSLTGALSEEVVTRLNAQHAVLIPTLTMMNAVTTAIGGKVLFKILGKIRPSARMHYQHAQDTVATFLHAGCTILAGTDANTDPSAPAQVPFGTSLHDEMARLVQAGLTEVQALQAATSHTAQTFALDDRGVVRAGMRADLVLVGGNPTIDIAATRNIRQVWIGGAPVFVSAAPPEARTLASEYEL